MTPDEARQRFIDEHQTFKDAAVALREYLDNLCRTLRVPAAVEAREKGIGSFVKKIYLNKYTRPWEEITDKVGGRIIVGTLQDVQKLRDASARRSVRTFAPILIWLGSRRTNCESLIVSPSVGLSRVKILGRAVESVLKENLNYG